MRVVDPTLLRGDEAAPVLVGARCRRTGTTVFPATAVAPGSSPDDMDEVELPTTGTLWSWTVQRFAPKAPPYEGTTGDAFEPYGVGYVDLGSIIVESRLVGDLSSLRVGLPVHLVVEHFDESGTATYAFAPAETDRG